MRGAIYTLLCCCLSLLWRPSWRCVFCIQSAWSCTRPFSSNTWCPLLQQAESGESTFNVNVTHIQTVPSSMTLSLPLATSRHTVWLLVTLLASVKHSCGATAVVLLMWCYCCTKALAACQQLNMAFRVHALGTSHGNLQQIVKQCCASARPCILCFLGR